MEVEIEDILKDIYEHLEIKVNFIEFRKYEIITKIEHRGVVYESKFIYKYDSNLTLDANIEKITNIIDNSIILHFYRKGE